MYLLICFAGDEHVLGEPIDREDNDSSNKMRNADPQCKDHKATTSRI